MKSSLIKSGLLLLVFAIFGACGGESTDVVESGTYTGTIQEVVPEESEIYVETPDGETLELYFIKKTKLVKDTTSVPFDSLQKGQKVQVKVKKTGKRLDPLRVEIMSSN